MHRRYRTRYSQLFVVYGNFIAADRRAHFAGMVTCIGRIFDDNVKTISIGALLKAEPSLAQVRPEILTRANELWKTKVIHLRHEVVAHRPGGSTVEDAFQRANISLHDVGLLIGLLDKLVDAWSRRLGCHSHNLSGARGDLVAVLEALMRTRADSQAARAQGRRRAPPLNRVVDRRSRGRVRTPD